MKRSWAVAVAAAITLISAAQPQAAEPTLGLDTYVARCLGIVVSEGDELSNRAARATTGRRDVLATAFAVRRLSRLLLQSATTDADGRDLATTSIRVLLGFQLFRGRHEIDTAVVRLLEWESATPPDPRLAPVQLELQRFQDAVSALGDDPWPDERNPAIIDDELAAVVSPLRDAIETLLGVGAVDHWLARTGDATDALGREVTGLGERISLASIPEPISAALLEITRFLERGLPHRELRADIQRLLPSVDAALEVASGLSDASWIESDSRRQLDERLESLIVAMLRPQTRSEALEQLDRLAVATPIVRRLTALEEWRDTSLVALQTTIGERLADLDASPIPARARVRLELLLDGVIAFRELGRPDLPGELQIVFSRLERRYRDAEQQLLDAMPVLLADPSAWTDPARSAAVRTQRAYLSDVQRVAAIPETTRLLSLMAPDAAGVVGPRLRGLAVDLLDANRRPDATRLLEHLHEQLQQFYPLPGETLLRRQETAPATGGLDTELAAAIDLTRSSWARAWAHGEYDGVPHDAMALAHRLMTALTPTAEIARLRDAHRLDRWAAWELPSGAYDRILAELPGRMKLATHAAIAGDAAELARQLDVIETELPAATLIARLVMSHGRRLDSLPDGPIGTIGQVAGTAPIELFERHRRDLATASRVLMELEYARASGHTEVAEQLRLFVERLADDLEPDRE